MIVLFVNEMNKYHFDKVIFFIKSDVTDAYSSFRQQKRWHYVKQYYGYL